jgi:predicted DNA-binding protein with PD1-like motif
MKSKLLDEQQGQKTYAVIFDKGDEVAEGLLNFAKENKLSASHFTAVGGFSNMTLGYFDRQKMEYKKIPLHEQVEVLSMMGDIAINEKNGEPKVHAHVVVGKADGSACGGHIMEAKVWPTLEVIVVESPRYLQRQSDPETGLALIKL